MGAFKYVPPREVEERHRASSAKTSPRGSQSGKQRNVEAILSLGSVRYFTYRGLVLAVPPVPFKLGQRVLTLYLQSVADSSTVQRGGDKQAAESYYRQLALLAKAMWPHVRPTGKVRRMLKRLHLMRNIFRDASEKELRDITDFFLQGRMTSTVQATETMTGDRPTTMSSMNFKSS